MTHSTTQVKPSYQKGNNCNIIYKKDFRDPQEVDKEVRHIITNFILLLHKEVQKHLNKKLKEYKVLFGKDRDNKKILDSKNQELYLNIIKCYKMTELKLNQHIESVTRNYNGFLTPKECYKIINATATIVNNEIYEPLKGIKSESSFIHKLKMLFSNIIEKLGFGKKGYSFFQPKPLLNDTENIIKNVETIKNAIYSHYMIG